MASDNLNEQEIQFKKRARRRLVGAVALVLLMVTVLPMLLDDRASKAPQQEIAISIPSQDSEFNSKIVPVKPEASESSTQTGSAIPEDQPVTEPQAGATDEIMPLTPPVESRSEPVAQPKPAPVKPATVPAPVKTVPSAPVAKPSESAKPVESKPTVADATKKDSAEKAAGFLVQVGVFSDPDNVKQLQQKLAGLGIKSNTEKLDTPKGPKIRLRSQLYSTRPQAEQALDKIKGAGLTGMVVTSK
ncbi:SPOR domain-containing protein [Methylovorus menthalis]|uniref:SPOR domain-containing protein n=1 Tax=Methylovorus menthalis TaxID=1002227 RepID=UPI001E62246E|nr:SPOR domain-containing protein [Methylovorus menthalis]MCB4811565.1 SPOR domain-containing protein [Methylovorus menthalis]